MKVSWSKWRKEKPVDLFSAYDKATPYSAFLHGFDRDVLTLCSRGFLSVGWGTIGCNTQYQLIDFYSISSPVMQNSRVRPPRKAVVLP